MSKHRKHDEVLFIRLTKEEKAICRNVQKKEDMTSISEWARRIIMAEARKRLKAS